MIEEDMNDEVNQLYHSLEIPNKGLSYNYPGLEHLNEDFPSQLQENSIVHICAYNVNILNKYPFIQYFLYKPYNENNFSFSSPDLFDYVISFVAIRKNNLKNVYRE